MTSCARLAFAATDRADAAAARTELVQAHGDCDPAQADVLVVLGGDGRMLQALHDARRSGAAVFGINFGSVGFLMNPVSSLDLRARIAAAQPTPLTPLHARLRTDSGEVRELLAFNEIALQRSARQTAHLRLSVNGQERLSELVCDGVIVATPAGSTAYNLSAHGPILPIDAELIAVTPICPFRPRRWRGAILPQSARVGLKALDIGKRPVGVTADFLAVPDVVHCEIWSEPEDRVNLLFDPGHELYERVVQEQFAL